MKKNITINLCGRLYQIDEDAYELLSQYMDTLRAYFRKSEGGEEIANDIEERVAELFDELRAQGILAITIEHVQQVIHQIGQVEEIASENPENSGNQEDSNNFFTSSAKETHLVRKKFFRDSQNKMLAGVFAGCAQYFGSDVNIWRCGYVIFWIMCFSLTGVVPFIFIPLLLYFLLAIFTHETETPEDVLQMKGKEVNPQNLAAEVQEITLQKEKKGGTTFWTIFVRILLIGVSIQLIIGFIVALCFFVAFLAANELMADAWWSIDKAECIEAINSPIIFCGIMILVSIGILLYCSIHAVASSFGKTPVMKTRQRIIWFLLWIASVAGIVGSIVFAVGRLNKANMDYRMRVNMSEDYVEDTVVPDSLAADTLVIDSLTTDTLNQPIPQIP
ncbi:MAG: PspC domain-containing protein [Bacteroidaceae bacterium]|nr:PspC domain-containing protein [Bacteroidaceae bacterium]